MEIWKIRLFSVSVGGNWCPTELVTVLWKHVNKMVAGVRVGGSAGRFSGVPAMLKKILWGKF